MAQSGGNKNFIEAHQKLRSSALLIVRGQRLRLEAIVDLDAPEVWEADGCRTFAQWLSGRLGISQWLASRLVNAAHALPFLPLVDEAFQEARLGIEKVIEVTRFATPQTEGRLVKWAERVSPASIRRKADAENRKAIEDATDPDRDRWVRYWWFDDGRRFGLEGEFPPDQGAVIAKALDRLADAMPNIVDEEHPEGPEVPREETLAARRADAVYSMASRGIAEDQDSDRATIVVHAPIGALSGRDLCGCEIENGPAIHPETARRLACDGILEVVLHNELGEAVGIGHKDRKVPRWMLRQLKYRDGRCTFPGCESNHFLHAHHIVYWCEGGPTELWNLTLVCTFHHKLLHEYGWKVKLGLPGITHWYRPNGAEYVPSRAPPTLALTG